MTTKEHNQKEACAIYALIERERYILGEQLGRDPRESFEDMETLEKRVSEVILNGIGEWLAEQIGDPVEKA